LLKGNKRYPIQSGFLLRALLFCCILNGFALFADKSPVLIEQPRARVGLERLLHAAVNSEERSYALFNLSFDAFFSYDLDVSDSFRKKAVEESGGNPTLLLLNRALQRFNRAARSENPAAGLNQLLSEMMALLDSFDRATPQYLPAHLNREVRIKVLLLNNIRGLFSYVGRTSERYDFYQRKLQEYVKSGNLPAAGVCYHSLGGHYYARAEFDKAMYMYWRAMDIFETLAPAMYADEVNAIAQLYYDLGNAERSLEFAKKSSEHYKRYKGGIPEDALYVSELLFARVALDRKDLATATRLLQNQFADTQYVAYMLQRALQEVELALLKNDADQAEKGVLKAIELEQRFEVPFYSNAGVVETDYWLGKVQLSQGRSQEALQAYERALLKAQQSNYLPKLIRYHRSIAELHASRGAYEAAVKALDSYIYLRDSLDYISYRTQIANGEMAVRQETLSDRLYALNTEKVLQDSKLKQTRLLLWIAVIGSLLLLALAYVIYRQLQINKSRSQELVFRGKLLQEEMRKSDQLLLNILPGNIAEELKETGQARARQFENVTVLFTDFVGFTTISAQLTPAELVEEIHRHFTAFDAIIVKHGLEKIKTIGDAYLAVCGLPETCEDHAERTLRAAIDIRDYIEQQPSRFGIRIGVHSGPVVAGIVGVKKYAYDIWGDTVNTAARMEQKSEPGKINITGQTLALVEHRFDCRYRGKIEAKNKGEIDMYFVNGEKPVPFSEAVS